MRPQVIKRGNEVLSVVLVKIGRGTCNANEVPVGSGKLTMTMTMLAPYVMAFVANLKGEADILFGNVLT